MPTLSPFAFTPWFSAKGESGDSIHVCDLYRPRLGDIQRGGFVGLQQAQAVRRNEGARGVPRIHGIPGVARFTGRLTCPGYPQRAVENEITRVGM